MKRVFLFVASIALLVALAGAANASFVDNFDDGYQSWLKWDGVDTYMVDNNPGELRLSPPGPDTEVRVTSKDKFLYGVYEIVFRSTNNGWNYLYFGFCSRDPWVNPSAMWRVDGNLMLCAGDGPGQANWDALSPNSPYLVPGVWHTLKLTWQPGSLSAVYDGNSLGSTNQFVTDTPLPLVMDAIRYTSNSVDPLVFEIDSITVSDLPTTVAVSGTVNLLNFGGDKTTVPVTVELNGVPYAINLAADGKFTILDVEPGTYDIRIKASHWLAKTTYAVGVSANTDIGTIDLTNGDINDDNGVDESDLAIMSNDWYLSSEEASNANSDLNGDGGIDESDLAIMSSAWYSGGD